jgi:hypothetical protein
VKKILVHLHTRWHYYALLILLAIFGVLLWYVLKQYKPIRPVAVVLFFWIIGGLVSGFTILPAVICLAFGIPATKRLDRENMLVSNHPIIKRYLRSVVILTVAFAVVCTLVCLFGSRYAIGGYVFGTLLTFVRSMSQLGTNAKNIADYVETQCRYFSRPEDDVVNFLSR